MFQTNTCEHKLKLNTYQNYVFCEICGERWEQHILPGGNIGTPNIDPFIGTPNIDPFIGSGTGGQYPCVGPVPTWRECIMKVIGDHTQSGTC